MKEDNKGTCSFEEFMIHHKRRRREALHLFGEHRRFHNHPGEFHRMRKSLKYFHPGAVLFSLLILFLLFKLAGFETLLIFIAALIIAKDIVQIVFFLRLEKKVLKPIEELKNGVEEIAGGNFNVKVNCNVNNEIGLLVASFNEMARKLYENEKRKTEYEENRKSLMANISHDLKTPITSIQGYMEAILDNGISWEAKARYLQTMHSNIIYINKLIDDLFLLSKLDLDKLDFNCERVNLRAYMSDLMEEFTFWLEERHAKLIYSGGLGEDLPVYIDRKRIYQAIRNIIDNAIKYGPETGLVIRVALYRSEDQACVEISDNGPGIPEEKLPYVFHRFYRVDIERTKDLNSTGLGLAIARELVEAHGGRITVSCREGGGTSFRVTLPMGVEAGETDTDY